MCIRDRVANCLFIEVLLDDAPKSMIFFIIYFFNQLPNIFPRKGSKTKTIKGTKIPVMINVFKGRGKFLM